LKSGRQPTAFDVEPTADLTPQDVAKACGVSLDTVYSWISSGELKAIDFAGSGARRRRWRVTRAALEDFKQLRSSVTPIEPVRRQRPELASKAFY
jgi:excisionase family DNA binding protein